MRTHFPVRTFFTIVLSLSAPNVLVECKKPTTMTIISIIITTQHMHPATVWFIRINSQISPIPATLTVDLAIFPVCIITHFFTTRGRPVCTSMLNEAQED